MDRIDHKILTVLQREGRIPIIDLAESVGLSATPCRRRIANLEASGVITGYGARVDIERYGLMVNAFVSVRLQRSTDDAMRKFETAIQVLDEVAECCLVSGKQDYLLRVVSQNLKTYERFIRQHLTNIPEVSTVESIFCFGHVKQMSKLPGLGPHSQP